jgi:hypothetical protein
MVWIEFGGGKIAAREADSSMARKPKRDTRVEFEIRYEGAVRFAAKLTPAP